MSLKVALLATGLGVAVYWDVKQRRIPNELTVSMALLGMGLYVISDGFYGALASVKGLLVGFGLFFLPFVLGGLGGGDVKLVMAVGAIAGPEYTLYAAAYCALAGGVIALALLLIRSGTAYLSGRRQQQVGFPYAIAIAVGAMAAILVGPAPLGLA